MEDEHSISSSFSHSCSVMPKIQVTFYTNRFWLSIEKWVGTVIAQSTCFNAVITFRSNVIDRL